MQRLCCSRETTAIPFETSSQRPPRLLSKHVDGNEYHDASLGPSPRASFLRERQDTQTPPTVISESMTADEDWIVDVIVTVTRLKGGRGRELGKSASECCETCREL